jgi:hypothetical protein
MENILFESSFRAAVMIAAMAGMLAVLQVRSAAARHAAWSGVLLTMLVLPVWTAWGPELPLPVLPAAAEPVAYFLPDVALETPAAVRAAVQQAVPTPQSSWTWGEIAAAFYGVVALCLFLRLVRGTMRARKLTSAHCAAPVTVGWFQPRIILPSHYESWPSGQREAVLLHEQAHIRRRDSLVQWLALLNCCLFWFHPLAWWLERKLNVLAEEACDASVLGQGHSPQDYATYLLDIARTVQLAGARVSMHFAYRDRALSQRVQRILQGVPAEPLTRKRAVLAAAASAVILVASTSCTLDRTEERAAGEPTMNELMHRRTEKNRDQQARSQAVSEEVEAMTPAQAQAIESGLKAKPDDQDTYFKMVRYYQHIVDVQKLDALYLWFYQNAPDGRVHAGNINPEWDRSGYENGKQIWLAHLKKPNPSAEIYRRSASYFTAGDKSLAERTLLDAQKAHPLEKWSAPLADLYAQALSVDSNGEYRAKLEATTDPELLARTAQRSMRWVLPRSGSPNLELPRHLIERALSIQPGHAAALSQRIQLDDLAASIKARSAGMEQLTVTERFRALRGKLHASAKTAEPFARELLQLAAANPGDPEYGNAIFFANQTLGEAALQRNEKKAAAEYMRASMQAPATELLRYQPIDVTFARSLVDWGERTLVAEFLEHCAKFSQASPHFYDLDGWAAQIRLGKNPDLVPTHSYRVE